MFRSHMFSGLRVGMIVQKCAVDAGHGTMSERHIDHSQQTLAVGLWKQGLVNLVLPKS
jgi:hypothetical protein